ncbi:MAG: SDR family NAD(P)-dependent oxidoreductase [Parasphingopyxis sp.]|nr:SDR family NAD(P)-dependent oxidoreductase [Sphingomonadales bacterium]
MSGHLLIFRLGYTAGRLAERLGDEGWGISATRREAGQGCIAFDDREGVDRALEEATHILSSVPPGKFGDPVLDRYGEAIASGPARWIGYLSSTGVYGDTKGAWVDESAPVGSGRRQARSEADLAWQKLPKDVRIFRLPGIYGPGRSLLDRVRDGEAHRIDLSDQVFSRIHVEDIVGAVMASFDRGGPGIYNIADDLPASHNRVTEYACALLGKEPPPLQTMDEAGLSEAARGFYAENRRVANGKAKRELGWAPRHPTYREGLRALL